MKRALRKILRRTSATHDKLLTLVIELEVVMNRELLCYLYSVEIEEKVTPSHLLTGRRPMARAILPTMQFVSKESSESLTNHTKYMKTKID